jgi:hypothetical protein
MSLQGRSLDDLPLAAYSTGIDPEELEELDQAEDHGVAPPSAPGSHEHDPNFASAAAQVSVAPTTEALAAGGPGGRTPLRRRGVRLPDVRMPRLGRSKVDALAQAAPFQPVHQAVHQAPGFQPVSYQSVAPQLVPPAHRHVDVTPPSEQGSLLGRLPRASMRDPRVLAGGTVVVGLMLLGVSLLNGGGPASGSGPSSSLGTSGALATAAPALATVEMTGATAGMYSLTGATGAGPAVDSQLDATWTDPLGESLGIVGLASQGVRTTDANFVLSWTMLIKNQPVTFTSRGSECTVGMAVGPRAVKGTFVCKNLKSGDGKHVVDLRGTYTT